MSLVRDDAIILQTFAYSDTSRILRLITCGHGVRSVIAKGARRPRSRFGGILEPFTAGVATFYAKQGRDLHTLSGFELTRSRQVLGGDLLRFGGASLLAELVLRTASEAPDPSLFHQLGHGLDRLERTPPDALESVILAEGWALTGRLGFAPALESCVHCERRLGLDETSAFDYAAGGIRCEGCSGGATDGALRSLPAHGRHALIRLCGGDAVRLARTAPHWQLLARFLSYHVVDAGPLRSLSFLAQALEIAGCAD